MRTHSQSPTTRASAITSGSGYPVLLAELDSCLEDSQKALLSKDLSRIEELTARQSLLLESICALKIAAGEDLRMQAARVLQLGRVQLAILRRWQQMLRMLSNFRAGIESTYEAELGSEGVVVHASVPSREA